MKKLLFITVFLLSPSAKAFDFTVTTSTTVAVRVRDAVCSNYGYQNIIDGSPNPQTKNQFVLQWIKDRFIEQVNIAESNVAISQARKSQYQKIQSEIIFQ